MRAAIYALVLGALLSQAASPMAAEGRRPNILLILADDMGFSDIGPYGGEISTPNLDRLAAGGLRFTQFYNAARCCPTRAALLTGLYPHQAGVGDMVGNLGTPAYQGYLNDRCATIAEVLRARGYTTIISGKWHVGENRPHWPSDRGFDRSFGLISGAGNYFKRDPERQWALDGQPFEAPDDQFYMTDAIADYAVKFLAEAAPKKQPFFLYLAFTAPHWPLHARPEEIARYRGKYTNGWDRLRLERHARQLSMGMVDQRWPLSARDPEVPAWDQATNRDELDLRMAVYAAQIDRMDQGIGKVLAQIRALGAEDNTLVLFLSDNGGCHEIIERSARPDAPTGTRDSFRSYGRGWANAGNTPFRQFKHWTHEGGIATPLIAYWPGVIPPGGKLTDQVGHVIDLLPTCLEAAGVEYPRQLNGRELAPLEGKSLAPVLRGQAPSDRTLFWEHEGNRAVRQGPWKLVAKQPGDWELYDLAADRTELNNLASQRSDKVKELASLWEAWAQRVGVQPRGQLSARKAQAQRRAAAPAVDYFLFTSFRGNGEDGLHLALSTNGYQWAAVNGDRSFLRPEVGGKLMRDPSLAQGPDGTFHLVWTTSWTAAEGKVFGHASSTDLIHWSSQQGIEVMPQEPTTRNIWAPELFYDAVREQWLVFWSSTIPGKFSETDTSGDNGYNHRAYYVTTKDFKTFSDSKLLYNPGFNMIDATLLAAGDKFYLIFKDERKNPVKKNLRYAVGNLAEGPFGPPSEPFTGDWVEGPAAIKIKNEYLVYFDHYTQPHYYGAVRSKDLQTWEDCSKEMQFPPGQRHGAVLRIPPDVARTLTRLSAGK